VVDTFIADLKDSVAQAKANPSGKGGMVAVYGRRRSSAAQIASSCHVLSGLGNSSPVGHQMVSELASVFLDTLYKA
jgi:sphinganine-1-phosphate aldolase